jgi:hypothetical protein
MDYSQCVAAENSLNLKRVLNQATVCWMLVDCNAAGRAEPSKYGRVVVTSDAGVVLFTGYVALFPEPKLAGAGVVGTMYQYEVTAISDELLLDQQSVPITPGSVGLPLATMIQAFTARVDPLRVSFVATAGAAPSLVAFAANAVETWSANAGALASTARNSYRLVAGQLSIAPIGAVTHALSDTAGTLDLSRFDAQQIHSVANDVTVCGETEPQEYVTDVFQGDGTTTTFDLTKTPLRVAGIKGDLLTDSFAGPGINTILWLPNDPGSRFSITSAGLAVNGGNGVDGATTLTAIDNVEMGGSLVLTTGGVLVSAGSDGYVGCFYNGSVLLENLFAGFHVTHSGGTAVVAPMLNGAVAGSSVTLVSGHAYTFRLRYSCREMQRLLTSYYMSGATGPQQYGGALVDAAASLVLEVQDTTGGVNQTPVVLYDGSINIAPATCFLCVINSPAFTGSIQSVSLERTGTAWVRSQQTTGNAFTRRIGLATTGADCKLETTGKLVFYTTSMPQVGELITLTYRTSGRAVARMFNQASVTAQGTAVVPGVSRWIGSVTRPGARSSADCENAGLALLSVSTSASAAWAGKYVALNPQQSASGDIWPGDVLSVQAAALNLTATLIVRSVSIAFATTQPELLTYTIAFANDWADAVSVKTLNAVPKDVWLPQTAAVMPTSLQSLSALTASVLSTQINVIAGVTPPSGGGFEVRRVDWQFGAGSDGTLVLRSPVANFTIVREAAIELYYVRMYDGSTPRNYSRFSSAICASVPL